jgi:hypothetical protein
LHWPFVKEKIFREEHQNECGSIYGKKPRKTFLDFHFSLAFGPKDRHHWVAVADFGSTNLLVTEIPFHGMVWHPSTFDSTIPDFEREPLFVRLESIHKSFVFRHFQIAGEDALLLVRPFSRIAGNGVIQSISCRLQPSSLILTRPLHFFEPGKPMCSSYHELGEFAKQTVKVKNNGRSFHE